MTPTLLQLGTRRPWWAWLLIVLGLGSLAFGIWAMAVDYQALERLAMLDVMARGAQALAAGSAAATGALGLLFIYGSAIVDAQLVSQINAARDDFRLAAVIAGIGLVLFFVGLARQDAHLKLLRGVPMIPEPAPAATAKEPQEVPAPLAVQTSQQFRPW